MNEQPLTSVSAWRIYGLSLPTIAHNGASEIVESAVIISSLNHINEAVMRFAPSHVVSILDRDDASPAAFARIDAANHLKMIEPCSAATDESTEACVRKIIEFAKAWASGDGPLAPLLIHCHLGVARSTAAAYIILCAIQPEKCERRIAAELRASAPHAEPNLLLISAADAVLGRDDRMTEAILDLCPCSATVSAPIVTLPVAA